MLMPLTEGARIDELRHALRESEQPHQAAEIKLADRQRRLGTVLDDYARDFPLIFNRTGAS